MMFLILYILALALTCAFSFITYRLIEIPGQKLGRFVIAMLCKHCRATVTTQPPVTEGAI
jgi:peptidoglycan/LPS O-acetylase OafA/YrhL